MRAARDRIMHALQTRTGFDELPGPGSNTPNSSRSMEIMEHMLKQADETGGVPFRKLDQLRRNAGSAAGNVQNRTDMKAGNEIIDGLDETVDLLTDADAVGDIAAVQKMLPEAREIWGRMSRSQGVEDAITAGTEQYTSGAASGIKRQFAKLLKSGKYTDAEKQAIKRVIDGSEVEQLVNSMGSRVGQIAQVGGGLGFGGIGGAIMGSATGGMSRELADEMAMKNAEMVRALIAKGGFKGIPEAGKIPRQVIEALMRRIGASTGAN